MASGDRTDIPDAPRSRSPRLAAPLRVFARDPPPTGSVAEQLPGELRAVELADVINDSRCLRLPERRLTVPPPPPSRLMPASAHLARVPPPPVPLPSAPHFLANLPEGADGTRRAILWSPSLVSWLPTSLDPRMACTVLDAKAYTLAMRGPLMANGEHFLVPIPPAQWSGRAPTSPERRPSSKTWVEPPPPPAPLTVEEPALPQPLPRRQDAQGSAPRVGKTTAPAPVAAQPAPLPVPAAEDVATSAQAPESAPVIGEPAERLRQQMGFPAVPPGMPEFSVGAAKASTTAPAPSAESPVAAPSPQDAEAAAHPSSSSADPAPAAAASDDPPPVPPRDCSTTPRVSSEGEDAQSVPYPGFQVDWGGESPLRVVPDSDDEWGGWQPPPKSSRQTSGASSDPLGAFMPSVYCGPKQSLALSPPQPARKAAASAPP